MATIVNGKTLAHRLHKSSTMTVQPKDAIKTTTYFDSVEVRPKGQANLNPGEDTRIELYLLTKFEKIYKLFAEIRLRNDNANSIQLLNGFFFFKKFEHKDGKDQTIKTITDQGNYLWWNISASEDERNTLAGAIGQNMTAGDIQQFNDWSTEDSFDGGFTLLPGEERTFYIPIMSPIVNANFDIGCNRTQYQNSSVTLTMADSFVQSTSAGEATATDLQIVMMGEKAKDGMPRSELTLKGTTQKSIVYYPALFSTPVTISPGTPLEQIQIPTATGVTPLFLWWIEKSNNLTQEARYSSAINLPPEVPGDPDPRDWVPIDNLTVYNEETIIGHSNMDQNFLKYVLNANAGNNRLFNEKNIYQSCVTNDAVKAVSQGGNTPIAVVRQGHLKVDIDVGDYVSATGTDQAVLRCIVFQKGTMQLGPNGFKNLIYSANV